MLYRQVKVFSMKIQWNILNTNQLLLLIFFSFTSKSWIFCFTCIFHREIHAHNLISITLYNIYINVSMMQIFDVIIVFFINIEISYCKLHERITDTDKYVFISKESSYCCSNIYLGVSNLCVLPFNFNFNFFFNFW